MNIYDFYNAETRGEELEKKETGNVLTAGT
jgi:hypothetical protein